MEFFSTLAADGLRILGLYSRVARSRYTVVHIHGYGGDFYSNLFVRRCHEIFPRLGISFLSANLRSAGYLVEIYADDSVTYVGSALVDHDEVSLDVEAIIDALEIPRRSIILQGHSFGTNVVKRFARTHTDVERVVLLSPADSVSLYANWIRSTRPLPLDDASTDTISIRWDLFGIVVEDSSYPIPIAEGSMQRLLASEVFREWSSDAPSASQLGLIVVGSADPITNFGTTADRAFFGRAMPNSTVKYIDGARHLFSGFEASLCEVIAAWIRSDSMTLFS